MEQNPRQFVDIKDLCKYSLQTLPTYVGNPKPHPTCPDLKSLIKSQSVLLDTHSIIVLVCI